MFMTEKRNCSIVRGWTSRFLVGLSVAAICVSVGTVASGEPWPLHIIDGVSKGADGVRLADVNGDGLQDITTGWEEGGVTRVYVNPGYDKARNPWPSVSVGATGSVEDAVFVDLDADGATDVVSSCEGKTKTVYVQWAPSDRSKYMNPDSWSSKPIPASVQLMQWMFAMPMQVDGRYGPDIVVGGKHDNAAVGWFQSPKHPRDLGKYVWHPISQAGWIMSIILSDMDGDGDRDIVVSDRFGEMRGCRWLENPGSKHAADGPWTNHFIGGRGLEAMFMRMTDLDGDGLQDALLAVKGEQIRWFRRLDRTGTEWEDRPISFEGNTGSMKGVAVTDVDHDGRLDLVVSCEHADPPKSGVFWLSYDKSVFDRNWTFHDISGPRGIKYDRLELLDLDGDGDLDPITTEERDAGRGIGVVWYENPFGK